MNHALTIPKKQSEAYGKDYHWLRQQGIAHIEALSGNLWTDYNTHDPGITILELLCYVLTDLGFRIAKPISEIVASPDNPLEEMHKQFLSALHVLPCAPVTANDYRKILIRIEGVKNVWLLKNEPAIIARYKEQPPQLRYASPSSEIPVNHEEFKFTLKGLYNILVEFEELEADSESELEDKKESILQRVRQVYHHFRNLGEDVVEVKQIPEQEIVLCSDIEIEAKADPEAVWAAICFAINQYFSPEINFYTLAEMQAKGKSSEEIFDGPAFDFDTQQISDAPGEENYFTQKGFVDAEEVKRSVLPEQIRLSDLIRLIQKIPGVKTIRSLSFAFCNCEENPENLSQIFDTDVWLLCLKKGHKPVLCLDNTVLNFYKDIIPIQLKEEEARQKLAELNLQHKHRSEVPTMEDLPMPLGKFSHLGQYHTLQNHLPETYGLGQVGLPESSTDQRKVQAKQLKAYLLFFDQVLANYFAQLSKVKLLLSADNSIAATYFTTAVQQVKGLKEILPHGAASAGYALQAAELDNYPERKNQFLDHLLGRFNEQFNDYVFLLHRLYGQDFDHAAIRHKINFIQDYEQVSAWRGSAFDYGNVLSPERALSNVSGMEKRISRLLGFQSYLRQPLAALPYQVLKVSADSHAFYTWNIAKEASLLLQGNGHSINEVDAYEDLGLSSVLACEERHYRWIINRDGSTTSIALTNGAQKILATSVSQWATAVPTNELFEQAETTLQQITDAATVVFQLSPNQKKVSFVLQNAQGKTLARSAAFYPLLPGELESGNYSLAQADVDFVLAATENDFYFLVDEEAQEFCGFLQQSDSRIILYTEDHYSYFNALSDSLAVLLPERTEIMEYFLMECRLEGMYVVEHILLRPDKEDADPSSFMPVCIDPNGAYCRPLDPYSFRVSVILPGYSLRLRNKYFRKYAEQLIRLETPAHVLPRICFVDEDQMALFETTYQQWIQAKQEAESKQEAMDEIVNKELIEVIENLFTIYDQGYLTDCDDDTDNLNPIVLGSTFLGNLAPNTDEPEDE